jgi:cellobiose-specific phosphotransferase system component IIA
MEETEVDIFEMAMGLIAGAGDSRSYSMEAIAHARTGDFTEARACIEKAKEAMVKTHDVQTELIRSEMQGVKSEITLLMVHAQDHLTAAMLMRDMAEEFIMLYEKMKKGDE